MQSGSDFDFRTVRDQKYMPQWKRHVGRVLDRLQGGHVPCGGALGLGLAMGNVDRLTVEELLSREDLIAFVERSAGTLTTKEEFMERKMPEGVSPELALDLVEFVRRAGAGMLVCGQRRQCDHLGSWYAMTPELSFRVAHLGYRARPRGSLQREFDQYVEACGAYPAQLEELGCALSLDGVDMGYEVLRSLCMGERAPRTDGEKLAANALSLLAGLDGLSEEDVSGELLGSLYRGLTAGVEDAEWLPAARPATPIKSVCDMFSSDFIATAVQGCTPINAPLVMFVLFCSDAMWKKPIFPLWGNTMEVVVRGLLFTLFGMPLLRYVPLALPFWRWQCGMAGASGGGVSYSQSMFWSRFGGDMTELFSRMLGFLEQGLDDLALWVAERRDAREACRAAIRGSHMLNHRQQALLLDCLDDSSMRIDAAEYERRFEVVPSTAYTDLRRLVDLGFFVANSGGKARTYCMAPDFAVKLMGRVV